MASDNPDEWWQHSPEGHQKSSPSGQWQQGYRPQSEQIPPGVGWGQPGGPVPPQQGAWEIPPLGGATGVPPSKNNGPLIAVLGVVVVLVLIGVIGVVALRARESASTNTAAGSSSETTQSSSESTSSAATTTSALPTIGEPVLREGLSPVAVFGPTWAAGEDTYTMAFKDWPFAFRTPSSWGCMKGSMEKIADAQAWGCIDEQNAGARQRVDLMLRKCPNTCDAVTQEQYNGDWFDKPGEAKEFDDRTSYVETASNDKGSFTVDFSRFFADEPGGELVWQVGVYVESPAATKDAVLKTLNDVVTQTQ